MERQHRQAMEQWRAEQARRAEQRERELREMQRRREEEMRQLLPAFLQRPGGQRPAEFLLPHLRPNQVAGFVFIWHHIHKSLANVHPQDSPTRSNGGSPALSPDLSPPTKKVGPRGGCILAHAPGTGKSLTTITVCERLLWRFPGRRILILTEVGIVRSWLDQFAQWLGTGPHSRDVRCRVNLPVPVFSEDAACQGLPTMGRVDMYCVRAEQGCKVEQQVAVARQWVSGGGVMLCPYSLVASMAGGRGGREELWRLIVTQTDVIFCDEGHVLKDPSRNLHQVRGISHWEAMGVWSLQAAGIG